MCHLSKRWNKAEPIGQGRMSGVSLHLPSAFAPRSYQKTDAYAKRYTCGPTQEGREEKEEQVRIFKGLLR